MKKNEIVLYTQSTCKNCQSIKDALAKKNIEFTERPIEDFKEEWHEVVSTTWWSGTPVMLFKDNYFVPERDFNHEGHVIEILNTFEKPKHDDSVVALERMKTLAYNINSALQQINGVVKNINQKLGI